MGRSPTARLAILSLGLLWIGLPGCSSWPPWGKTSDTVQGITPPHERIAQLQKLAKDLPSRDPAERERIAADLVAQYPRETDPLIRTAMVRALGSSSSPAALEILHKAAKDPDADVRVVVCEALGRYKRPEGTTMLRELFAGDVDLDVRLAAARALGETRDPAALATLGAALEDRNPAMQYRVVQSLRKIAPQDLGNDVERWRQYVATLPSSPPQTPSQTPSLAEPPRRAF